MKQLEATSAIVLTGMGLMPMGTASRYWQLIRLDGTGQRRVEEIAIAKTFFFEQFSYLSQQAEVSDLPVQQQLMQIMKGGVPNSQQKKNLAERCLRCYISFQIEQACLALEARFGTNHGFDRYDLFPLILDDDGQPKPLIQPEKHYRSLATKILQTFDPDRASLSTWTSRLVRQHEELSRFLRERGVFLISDWALLNNTQPRQLRRILLDFHALTEPEIEQACYLLQVYHDVYRADRLRQRQLGILKGKETCTPPTQDQLTQMTQRLQEKAAIFLANSLLMSRLQTIATRLRQYRLHQQGGNSLVTDSLDCPEVQVRAVELPSPELDSSQDEQSEFLQIYRQQFLMHLDQAIERATGDRVTYLKRKSSQTAQHFLNALHLFHCQGKSMGEIASQVGLEAQFQVTRLMKLKEFRAAVRQYLLKHLIEQVLEKAELYANPDRLQKFNQQIETALDEQVAAVLQQAEAEAAGPKRQTPASLFSRRLCHHLDNQIHTQRVVS